MPVRVPRPLGVHFLWYTLAVLAVLVSGGVRVEVSGWLVTAALVAGIVTLCVLTYALVELIASVRAARRLLGELESRLLPLIDKADVAVDAFNAEMLRVDAIISQLHEVATRVHGAATLVQEFANVPGVAASVAGERIRSAWSRIRRERG